MLFARRAILKTGFFALAMVAGPTFAAGAPQDPGAAGTTTITLDTVEVISEQLDIARLQIQPSLGASTYYFGPEALRTVPQGENAPLNQGVASGPCAGEHANVQFRINGVQLPEGLSVFGQALETRFARGISLLTGALPAQYGRSKT
jgi:hypothetical protein